MFPSAPTKGLQRLHQLDSKEFPFGQLLQHLGDLVVSTADQSMPVDRLDHVANVDDLDLVNHTSFTNSLKKQQVLTKLTVFTNYVLLYSTHIFCPFPVCGP